MRWRTVGVVAALAVSAGALAAEVGTRPSADQLLLFPTTLTMGARGQRTVMAATRSGKIPPRVEWSLSNPALATLSPHGAAVDLKALAPGRLELTARVNGRTATAGITITDDPDLRFGSVRWSLSRLRGLTPRPLLDASRVDDDGAELFAVDADPMGRFSVVRALAATGMLLWQSTVRGAPWAGDRFGGLLARLGPLDQPSRALARVDRPGSRVPSWRYRARGDLEDFAEADDGTIFLVEHTRRRLTGSRDEDGRIVVLDGRTGVEVGHYTLPASTWQASGNCAPKGASFKRPSELGSLGEGANGSVYAQLLQVHDTWTRVCEHGRPALGRGRFSVSRELQLVRLTRTGWTPVRTLWRGDVNGTDTADRLHAIEDVAPGPIVELKSGELLALRTHVTLDAGGRPAARLHVSRIVRGDVVKDVVHAGTPTRTASSWRVLVDGQTTPWVYVADGATMQAMDL
ncbi:MAG TPA: hypothetical protein VG871_05075, partial [Vicinamibacterales bacterium]|nr:hypothetical protein [Vicinamibacterales bacterium]